MFKIDVEEKRRQQNQKESSKSSSWSYPNATTYFAGDQSKGHEKGKGKSKGKGKGKGKGKHSKGEDSPRKAGQCREWKATGKCSQGNKCQWTHPAAGGHSKPEESKDRPKPTGTAPDGKTDRPLCYKALKGNCDKGDKCSYYHPKSCTFFKKGECKHGKDCHFAHVLLAADAPLNQDGSKKV
jgi:hypothetical protein